METLVLILMTIVCFNFLLKQTYRKKRSVITISIVSALFVGLMWPYAIEQSKTQIADWLANQSLMLDISVILCIEVILQISFCILAIQVLTTYPIKKRIFNIYRFLRWFPGILIFPILFSILVALIFSFPGTSFSLIAWGLAGVILILIPVGTLFLRWLLPAKAVRLELFFLTNTLIAILGIVATVNGRTAAKGVSEINWKAFIGIIIILIVGALLGIIFRKIKIKKLLNKEKI